MTKPSRSSLFDAATELPTPPTAAEKPTRLFSAGTALAGVLARGKAIDTGILRAAMEEAFGASDASGAWVWKDAYEAGEVSLILFLRRFWPSVRAKAPTLPGQAALLGRLSGMLPTHTRRSEESRALQQYSTPLGLGLAAAAAAALTAEDLVLEPSAGTGLLAIHAELAGARLALNELAGTRAGLLRHLFAGTPVTEHDAEAIHDRLDPAVVPSVVLMNPPFSASHRIDGRHAAATLNHLRAALSRLAPGGRLVAITGEGFAPDRPAWREGFEGLAERGGRLVFSAGVAGGVYARHGTTTETRLSVFDRAPRGETGSLTAPIGVVPDVAALLAEVERGVPPRLSAERPARIAPRAVALPGLTRRVAPMPMRRAAPKLPQRPVAQATEAVELDYEVLEALPAGVSAAAALYEPYTPQTVRVPGAQPHPTKLVESAAMASVAPPKPTHRPLLPMRLVTEGVLSEPQLETLIYAGQAHAAHLPGLWTLDETHDNVLPAPADAQGAVRFRQGYFLGDGTGCGKGRQAAGIILDNWSRGRRRALWISKSDALIEDAQRDWSDLGQERLQVVPLSWFQLGRPIMLGEGILFTTFATLRSEGRDGKGSRLDQIVAWLGADFDGVVILDESHELANAVGGTGERGYTDPSQQGRAGLRLQHRLPDARVVYQSATGATRVQNLAYASRLGLWGGANLSFAARADFVTAMEEGGIAALEVLARDLKALGLYAARSLSYEGVEVDLLVHELTPEQTAIYDAYADAFQIIHANLNAALEAANITSGGENGSRTLNSQAKSAARSAFESNKQRFFNHLLTAMKCPALIEAVQADLDAGHACVVQVVSTGEALMERRIAEIPASEWGDLSVDVTPREYVCDYLMHSFPTALFEPYTDSEGNLLSRPAIDEAGQPIQCREAIARRDAMLEHLGSLPPVQAALDQIVQHFGTDMVAEVTGRSRRIVRKVGKDGSVGAARESRLALENRPAGINIGETLAFQGDEKQVLVFSEAGGTGRSYHADLGAKNQRKRVHYLLEAGWKAAAAIQGLGRTNRTNQRQPPLFRPVATNVKGEKRFLSTIARRLDSLGAITRGQRQTGGQGMFRPEDNLESVYARIALRHFFSALYTGRLEGCSLNQFQDMTGLALTDRDGSLREELPPIGQFLNRCLALRIETQNRLFAAFEERLEAVVEGAIQAGTYDVGLEVLTADSFRIVEREIAHTHQATGARTYLLKVAERRRVTPLPVAEVLDRARLDGDAHMAVNAKTGRAALVVSAPWETLDDGSVVERVRLVRPTGREGMTRAQFASSQWKLASRHAFEAAWEAEVAALPQFEERHIHLVTGLLLPIWNRLPCEGGRVYRLVTDEGERVVGRLVEAEVLNALRENLGLGGITALEPAEAWEAVLERGATLHLAGGAQVRRSRVMGARRVELTGFQASARDALKAIGLMAEVIQWRTRLFLPVTDQGPSILAGLFALDPLARCVGAAPLAQA